jgi:hypothetical protein
MAEDLNQVRSTLSSQICTTTKAIESVELANGLPLEDSMQRLDQAGPIFIMGCPRSGTSVLADCIGLLPNMIVRIGTLANDRIAHLLGSGELPPSIEEHLLWAERAIFWRAFVEMHMSSIWALRDMVRARSWRVWRRSRRPISEFLFGYKEPFLIFAAEPFAKHFSKAKFVHIIRDGRDCADSMLRTYAHALTNEVLRSPFLWRLKGSEIGVARKWQGWFLPWWLERGAEEAFLSLPPFGRYVWMWEVMVRRGQELAPLLGPQRLLEVRYEEFCKRPAEVGQRLVEFLQIPSGGAYRRYLRSVNTRSVGCHRRRSRGLLVQSEKVGSPLLAELGYC